jgi:Tol biopolymer transport system component
MWRRLLEVIVVLILISLPGACATAPPTSQIEIKQPTKIVPSTEIPTKPFPRSTLAPTNNQPRWALPLGTLSGEIAYLSNRTGLAEIWLLDLVTGSERQLTETSCSDTPIEGYVPEWYVPGVQGFTWAPDGQRITYLVKCFDAAWAQLYVYDLETAFTISIMTRADSDSYPSWSPAGNRLLFSVITRGEVYIADLEGEGKPEVELITRTLCAFPVWSPNGKHIAYRGPSLGLPGAAGTRTYISVVDPEWNHLEYDPPSKPTVPDLPDVRSEWLSAPVNEGLAWSHDAQYLAVATVREAVPGSLGLVEIAGQVAHNRSGGLVQTDSNSFGRDFYNPVFSPDDRTLYFVSVWPDTDYGVRFGTVYSVLVQDLLIGSSSLDIQVTSVSPEDQLAGFPSLSPDGKWLIYAVKIEEANEIWIQAIDGAYRQRLVGDDFVNTRPVWRPLSE